MSPSLRTLYVIALAVGLSVNAQADNLTIDPAAQSMLKKMVAAYTHIRAYHSIATETTSFGKDDHLIATYELKVQRPNKIFWSHTIRGRNGKEFRNIIVTDGKILRTWESRNNTYTEDVAPISIVGIRNLTSAADSAFLIAKDPVKSIFCSGSQVIVGENAKVGNTSSTTIKAAENVTNNFGTSTLYIGISDHLIHKAESSYYDDGERITSETTFSLIEPHATFTNADFTFTPPDGAKLVTKDRQHGVTPTVKRR